MGAQELRQKILDDDLLVVPEIYDGLTAKIAEDVGFEAAIMGGFATSATLGIPEPVVSMAEMRDRAHALTYATDIPFVVDGATGFGNAAHTHRTVKEFAKAGIAGIFIEDQIPPRRMGHHDGPLELLEIENMEEKIQAAVRARDEVDEDIVIVAKTQAATKDRRKYESMEDAASRMNRYMDAGAELGCLYPTTQEEALYAAEHVAGPLKYAVVPSKDFCPSFEKVAEMGYAVANTPTVAAVETAKHIHNYYKTLYESRELTADGDDVTEYKSYVYDLQYDGYEQYE